MMIGGYLFESSRGSYSTMMALSRDTFAARGWPHSTTLRFNKAESTGKMDAITLALRIAEKEGHEFMAFIDADVCAVAALPRNPGWKYDAVYADIDMAANIPPHLSMNVQFAVKEMVPIIMTDPFARAVNSGVVVASTLYWHHVLAKWEAAFNKVVANLARSNQAAGNPVLMQLMDQPAFASIIAAKEVTALPLGWVAYPTRFADYVPPGSLSKILHFCSPATASDKLDAMNRRLAPRDYLVTQTDKGRTYV